MRKTIFTLVLVLVFALVACTLIGCGEANKTPSDTAYWFSSSDKKFVAYNETTNNIDEAGSYWYFTSAKDVTTTLSVRINVDAFSTAYLYVNDKQVKSEVDTGIFSMVYKLSLKTGDKIKLHAFWVNSLATNDTGFEIQMLVMSENGNDYVLTEFDKSTRS
ncbi:MAG TPA: hypothetical protein PKX91_05360 [Clostridia bacterium]|jgi:hypothetical protein|nr:hypothetical protein [Clostridia bacterium]